MAKFPKENYRRVLVSHAVLVRMFRSKEFVRVVHNGLPEGTEIVAVNEDWNRQVFDVIVTHPSFSEREVGEEIPILPEVTFEIMRADAE